MIRTWLSLEGEVLEEEEWKISPMHSCFYCGSPLVYVKNEPCPSGFLNEHAFITLCDRRHDR